MLDLVEAKDQEKPAKDLRDPKPKGCKNLWVSKYQIGITSEGNIFRNQNQNGSRKERS